MRILDHHCRYILQTKMKNDELLSDLRTCLCPSSLQMGVPVSVFTSKVARAKSFPAMEISGTGAHLLASAKPKPWLLRKMSSEQTGWFDWHLPTEGH